MNKAERKIRTYSTPHLEWAGFNGRGYRVDYAKVWPLPISYGPEGAKIAEYQQSTVGELARRFQKPLKIEDVVMTTIHAEDGSTLALSGSSFAIAMLTIFLRLRDFTDGAAYCVWNYYDEDHVTDDAHRSFHFFITEGEKILMDRVGISDSSTAGFDPTVFLPVEDREPIWQNNPYFDGALVKLNYRRFYTETLIGRLMVAREDLPNLFHMDRAMPEAYVEIIWRLERIRRSARWVTLITAVILLFLLLK